MSFRRVPRFCLLVLLLGSRSSLSAQDLSPCSYELCALRIEGNRILEGRGGTPVGKVGTFYGDLRILEAGPDSAAAAAHAFRQNARQAFWFRLGGSALVLASVVWGPSGFESLGDAAAFGLYAGGLGLTFHAGSRAREAGAQLARSIWHYNERAAKGMAHPNPQDLALRPSHYGHMGAVLGSLAGLGIGLAATSDLSWEEATTAFLVTGSFGIGGGALGWLIGRGEER